MKAVSIVERKFEQNGMNGVEPWLILHHTPTVGAVTTGRALQQFGSAEQICRASGADLRHSGLFREEAIAFLTAADSVRLAAIAADLKWLEQPDNDLLPLSDGRYPQLLRQITDPPLLLYLRGDADLLSFPQLAVVGSRNPDLMGREIARDFSAALAKRGLVITSGLAQGIDAAAHRGALAEDGGTIAVVGTGLDRVYPTRNRQLAHQIAATGAVISEYPIGTGPLRENFPRRNRIISGLALGTLVVQAARRSGSLITARVAAEQGREVFAIPGSIHNPLARGTHWLIRQGARLVETTADLLEELGPLLGPSMAAITTEESESVVEDQALQSLLTLMGHEPMLPEQLVEYSGLTVDKVSPMIVRLEIEGRVVTLPGGRVQRRR